MIETTRATFSNGEGWELVLKRTAAPERLQRNYRPLVIIPGYAMNSFIFGFHPSGLSMEAFLANEGFEVWSLHLRNQGEARCRGGSQLYGVKDLVMTDIRLAIEEILIHTATSQDRVDLLGASLGGALMCAYITMCADHRAHSLVGLGAPLRWETIHPLLRIAFASPKLVGMIPMPDTRPMVQRIFPIIRRFPSLLKIYMHPELTDESRIGEMIATVDQPNRKLNREMALWLNHGDLVLEGINITEAMRHHHNPILCILANADGIVPPDTARSLLTYAGSHTKTLLEIGDAQKRFAHADLFISHDAPSLVFQPMSHWLKSHYHD